LVGKRAWFGERNKPVQRAISTRLGASGTHLVYFVFGNPSQNNGKITGI
jgi:hypothetical protein